MLSEQQQRIMGYFIEEAKDHLNTIEQGLLNLKATIDDPEMVHEVFRAAHSVKGGAAMLGLTSIQHTAHRLEDYFKVLKECPVHIDQKLETLLLRVYDTLQELLEQLQRPFGLTDDKAEEAMAEVEPVFVELNQHLGQLVAQVGGQPPEDVSLASPVPASVLEAPTQSQPVAEESALRFIFHNDVPARLREMLQLFKQDDTPETRQQLRTLCRQLSQPGEQLDLPAWCDLLKTAERAIAHSENSYRALAPVVIKDIKRAQEQVLAGHINGITVSNDLLLLLPPEELSIPEETQFDADLADLLGSAEDDELGLFAMESVTATDPNLGFLDLDELTTAAELDANDSDSVFNLDPLLAADNNSHEPQLNFDLIDQIDEALPSAPHAQGGPEVGTAELNSLADLFEGEDADLGLAWQEEVIGEAVDSTPEPLEFDATSDFSDLLFQDGSEELALQEMDEDLSGLLNQTAEQVEAMSEPAIDFGFDESPVEAENLSFDFTNLEDSEAEPDEVDDAFLFSLPAEPEASSGANPGPGQSEDLDALFSDLPGDELSLESEVVEPINPAANESSIEALFASDDATDATVPFELDLESADLLDLSFESGDELTAAGLDLSDFEMGNEELLLDDGSANLVAEEEGLSFEDFDLAGLEPLDLSQPEQPQPEQPQPEQPPALSEHEPSYQPEVVADPWTELELSQTDLEQPIQSANDLSAGWSDDSTPTELEPFTLEQEPESPNLDLETDLNWLEASGQSEQPGAEPLDQMLVDFNEFDALAHPNLELSADEAVDLDLNFEALNPDVSDADFGTEIETSTGTDISDELNLDLFDQPSTSDELDLNFDQPSTSDELDLNLFDQAEASEPELDLNFDQPGTSDELDLNLFDQPSTSDELDLNFDQPGTSDELDLNFDQPSSSNDLDLNFDQPGTSDELDLNFNQPSTSDELDLNLFDQPSTSKAELDLNFDEPSTSDELDLNFDEPSTSDELDLSLFDQSGTSESELDLNFDQPSSSNELDLNFDQPSTSDELDLNFNQPSTSDELDLNLFDQFGTSEAELDLNFDEPSTSELELNLFDQPSTSDELDLNFDQPSSSNELDLNFDQPGTSDELDLNLFDQPSPSDELDLNFDQPSTSDELDLNLFDQAEASELELNLFDQADAAEVVETPSLNSDLSDLDLNLFADSEELNEQMQDVPAASADSLDFDNPFELDLTAEAGPEISELELAESDLFVESEAGDLAAEETEAELGDLDNLFTLSPELPDTRSDHLLVDETLSGTFDQDLAAELPAADFNVTADLPDAELADLELSEFDLFAAADDNPDASTAGMEFDQQSELFQDSAATDFDLDLEMEVVEPPVFSADLGLPEPENSNPEDTAVELWFESATAEASQDEAPADLGLWQDTADASADDLMALDFSTLEPDAAALSALPELGDEASFDFGFDPALETTEPTAGMQAEESSFDLDFLNLEAAAIEPEPSITDLEFPDDLRAEAAIDLDLSDLGDENAAELNFWGEPESEISLDAGDLDLSLPELEFNPSEARAEELPDLDFELAELGEEQPDQSAAEPLPSTDEFADLADFFGADTATDTDLNAGDLFDAVELSSDVLDFSDAVPTSDAAPTEDTSTAADDFSDLETMLGGVDAADTISAEHAPLDDLQAALADDLPTVTAIHEADDDSFADLEALLEEPAELAHGSTNASEPHSVVSSIPAVEDEFSDLEALLQDADQTLGGGSSPAWKSSTATNRRSNRRGGLSDQTMRVTVRHLDNLNNLVGEMVVNRNSLEQAQERLRQFLDNLLYQVQQLSDVGQRMRDLYERSLLESSLLSSRRGGYQAAAPSNFNVAQTSHATGASFDALEMDRFTGFHTLSQEMIELIVRVRESASDIDFVVEETDQVTRNFRQITTQLQEGLTRSRMVPFAQTADRLPRGVRDNSLKYGKQAELIIEGRDTLIDKMIVEQLYDPMTHLVNNAIAHGIETPEERIAAGKSPTGRIVIRAFHQGNQTVISVSDDGAGINPEQVRAKALAKGLITPVQAREMSRLDTYDLLFQHGFSTVDQVDDLRGRGVGLDVVRNNLNEIRGAITIDSVIGKGTSFTIRLPLTLSISKALCCISNRARIAFPMDGVEDMLDVPQERILTDEQGRQCIQWRDLLLPFQPLAELLRYNRVLGRGSVYGGNQEEDMISIVVLRSAGNFLALQVDQVLGEQEIVIKQLEGPVPKPLGVAGATVLGDGRIMPIADVLELIDLWQGRIRRESGSSLWDKGESQVPSESMVKSEPTVLIVDDSITVRELLSMTFSKVGYRVEQARDGQEAWEKLRSGLPCDLVFCDIEMPRMDGLELLSRIQKDPNLSHLPIAMLTSRGADRHRQMAVQLGAKGYFTKPYLEEVLLDAAQRMLKGEVMVMGNSIQ